MNQKFFSLTGLKLHKKLENTTQPFQLHKQTLNSTSAGEVNNVRHSHQPHGRKPIWGSLELEQLGIKEPTERKVTNQQIFDYAPQKEMKEEQLTDEKYKSYSEKTATRSGRCARGKEQAIVA